MAETRNPKPGLSLKTGIKTRLEASLKAKLLTRLKVIELLNMPEQEVTKIIEGLEKDPLFKKLIYPEPGKFRAIRTRKPLQARLSQSFYEINEDIAPDERPMDFESFIAVKKEVIGLIQKMGQDKFERFFLYRESELPAEEISRECNLALEETRKINDLLVELSVQSEFQHTVRPGITTKYTALARVEPSGQDFILAFLSPHLARGRYEINYDLIKAMRTEGDFSFEERKRLKSMLNTLELINLRHETLVRIIEAIVDVQKPYLASKDDTKLAPVSLRQLAAKLAIAPSTVSRAIAAKSVYLPWNQETALIDLLPGHHKVVMSALRTLMDEPDIAGKNTRSTGNKLTDRAMAQKLFTDFGLKVARRTVTACRHALLKKSRRPALVPKPANPT